MTTQNAPTISLDELATTLKAWAGPPRPRRQPVQRNSRRWRLVHAAAALAVVFVSAAYAAGFNPFAGISAANHPATSSDAPPASMTARLAEFSSTMEKMGHGHLLLGSARSITELPSGMRFYTIATSAGGLCLATVNHPGSSAKGAALECGDSLSRQRPITIASEQVNHSTPRVSYGLALDGVTAVSFRAGGAERTVPVKDNVWAYEGEANLRAITVHWKNGSTQNLIDGR